MRAIRPALALACAALALAGLVLPMSAGAQTPPPAPGAAPATRKPPPPACTAAAHRQFDFWLGDWQVFDGTGKQVGTSHVEAILGGCVLAEHWTSAGNHAGDGKSYNLYNAQVGHWEQFWVDAQGGRLVLSGGIVGGRMALEGVQAKPDPKTGIAQRERITWTPNADGSVRQLWESSTDAGKAWTVAFDGLYKHAPNP